MCERVKNWYTKRFRDLLRAVVNVMDDVVGWTGLLKTEIVVMALLFMQSDGKALVTSRRS